MASSYWNELRDENRRQAADQPLSLAHWNDHFIRHTPQMADIGLEITEVAPGRGIIKMPARPDWLGDPARGMMHPGALTVLADSAGGLAAGLSLPQKITYATLDLRMDYLRPASPALDTFCEAECYRETRNVLFTRGTVWQQSRDEPIASLQATFMLATPSVDTPRARAEARQTDSNPIVTPTTDWTPPAASEPVMPQAPIPYAEYLGLRVAPDPITPLFRMPFQQKLVGNPNLPAFHGGTVAALSETAATVHLIQTLKGAKFPKSIDFSIDYLRSARPEEVFAGCEIVRVGSRVALVQIRCWQKSPDYPVTVARAQFLLTPNE